MCDCHRLQCTWYWQLYNDTVGGSAWPAAVRLRSVGGGEPWDGLIHLIPALSNNDTIAGVLSGRHVKHRAISGLDYIQLDTTLNFAVSSPICSWCSCSFSQCCCMSFNVAFVDVSSNQINLFAALYTHAASVHKVHVYKVETAGCHRALSLLCDTWF